MTARAPLSPRTARQRRAWLVLAMVATIGGITVLGVLDERAMSRRMREDIVREQRLLAEVLAAEFRAGISEVDASGVPVGPAIVEGAAWRFGQVRIEPQVFLHGQGFSHGGEHRLLLWSEATAGLYTLQGRPVELPELARAAAAGEPRAAVSAQDALRLGLPGAAAVAGLAPIETGRLGRWVIVVVTSTQGQRARELRRTVRTVVIVSLVSLVVIGFGLLLLRAQRQERALEQRLARETSRAQQEAELAREGRAATMMTFAAGIAHELSTPLGVIAMRAEQLENAAEDERSRRSARAISEQVSRIREQARRFLAIARGAAPLRERFPAGDVLAHAAALVQHRFEAANVTLRLELQPDLPRIHGDARLLDHALTNLLLNACDASSPGDTVELSAATAGATLTIVVRDRGAGIEPTLANRIRPFFSTKADGEGTGLGLAIASEVMRMHRGELTFETPAEGGTRAVLRLPAEPIYPDDAPTDQAKDAAPAG